jgi:hypothetical protein
MSTPGELMATGVPAAAAVQIGQANHTSLKATGSTKAGALVLQDQGGAYVFATVSSSTGALLPPAAGAAITAIYNGGSNPLLVYANGTDTINALSAGASFSVTNAKSAYFVPSKNTWVANLSA